MNLLATRCPSCKTAFRVAADHLKIQQGWVQCGKCNEIFNAKGRLFAPKARAEVSAEGLRSGNEFTHSMLPDLPEAQAAPPPALAPQASTSNSLLGSASATEGTEVERLETLMRHTLESLRSLEARHDSSFTATPTAPTATAVATGARVSAAALSAPSSSAASSLASPIPGNPLKPALDEPPENWPRLESIPDEAEAGVVNAPATSTAASAATAATAARTAAPRSHSATATQALLQPAPVPAAAASSATSPNTPSRSPAPQRAPLAAAAPTAASTAPTTRAATPLPTPVSYVSAPRSAQAPSSPRAPGARESELSLAPQEPAKVQRHAPSAPGQFAAQPVRARASFGRDEFPANPFSSAPPRPLPSRSQLPAQDRSDNAPSRFVTGYAPTRMGGGANAGTASTLGNPISHASSATSTASTASNNAASPARTSNPPGQTTQGLSRFPSTSSTPTAPGTPGSKAATANTAPQPLPRPMPSALPRSTPRSGPRTAAPQDAAAASGFMPSRLMDARINIRPVPPPPDLVEQHSPYRERSIARHKRLLFTPAFVREARMRREDGSINKGVLGTMVSIAVLLGFLLFVQVVHAAYRASGSLSESSYRIVKGLCKVAMCGNEPLRGVGNVITESTQMQPLGGGVYRFTILLRNRRDQDVVLPDLELSLEGVTHNLLARKVFYLAEFGSAEDANTPDLLPANHERSFDIHFKQDGEDITSYRSDLFYSRGD